MRVAAGLLGAMAVMAVPMTASAQGPPKYAGSCIDAACHGEFGQRAVVHDPVGEGSCDLCHEETDAKTHGFKLTSDLAELCMECHDEFEGKVRHAPAAEGECTVCHDPHGSAAPKLLNQAKEADVCVDCHDDVTENLAFLHGPVAAGACMVCHDAHASDHPALLFAPDREVCVKCHDAIATRISTREHQHDPATEDCASCHHPHGAANKMILRDLPPKLCLECHDSIAEVLEEATVGHDAVTAGKSCTSCHDPHAAIAAQLLVDEPMALCMSCHDREVTSGEATIAGLGKLLAENPNHHGPIRDKSCTGCHEVHGGENFRLLTEAYPPGFYAPFEEERYALCFGCHEADAVYEASTDTLTNFRNGKQNLHYVHVHRTPKGRTCRACHETHASNRPRHMAESVPFGEWRIPIKFSQTPTGGSCSPGCHRPYRYDRDAAVANLPG